MDAVKIIKADFSNEYHCESIIYLLESYAMDLMGGGESLTEFTKSNLINELKKRPTAHIFLAFVPSHETNDTKKRKLDDGNEYSAAGLAICFEAFSTFACRPILNIHDMCVLSEFRRKGICSQLLFEVERFAKSIDCCKLTLEVLQGNFAAKKAYISFGFEGYELDPDMGKAEFWQKKII